MYEISDLPAGKRVGPSGHVIQAVDRSCGWGWDDESLDLGREEAGLRLHMQPSRIIIKLMHVNSGIVQSIMSLKPKKSEHLQAQKLTIRHQNILHANTLQGARRYLGNQEVCCFMQFSLNKRSEYPGAADQLVGQ